MLPKSLGLIFCLISGQVDTVGITLQPGMEEIATVYPSRPLSWTSSSEECDVQYGMDLCSATNYQWIISPGSTISLTVDCVVAQNPYSVRAVFWDYLGRAVHVEELGNAPCTVPLDITIEGAG
ncbi:MAG: hypothetical protein U9P12_08530, partial [Verrucomicrobiota bacterium]|nr:hypothetical protein [Verrucomicrobiota bacterium]